MTVDPDPVAHRLACAAFRQMAVPMLAFPTAGKGEP